MVDVIANTARHLRFGLRALLFMPIAPAQQRALGPEPALLVLVSLLVETLRGAFVVEQVRLSAWGVSSTLAYVALLTACLLLVRASRRDIDIASMISTLLAIAVWGLVLITAASLLAGPVFDGLGVAEARRPLVVAATGMAWLAWYTAAIFIYARRATTQRPRIFGLAVAMSTVGCAFVLPSVPVVDGSNPVALEGLLQTAFDALPLRRNQERDDQSRGKPIDVEAAYTRQAALIDAELGRLEPASPGRARAYFVGMATYSEQDVFKREITAVREIADRRLSTRGRSIVMINHRDTVETVPLANASNLERVLWRLAQQMDPETDILVLFVTTHGREGHMAVTFPGFSMNDLTPEKLSAILERTGIKNRVLILSACHSGSFIPALANPDTLVMAAARSDRASFGCSNERDWTYFGDALFNHALRETASFADAFDRAKALVAKWEAEQKMSPPSEPQIAMGARIAVKLDAFARGLEANTQRATGSRAATVE